MPFPKRTIAPPAPSLEEIEENAYQVDEIMTGTPPKQRKRLLKRHLTINELERLIPPQGLSL